MQLTRKQLKTIQRALYADLEDNFDVAAEAISNGDWGCVDYKREQRLEIRELLDLVREEIIK